MLTAGGGRHASSLKEGWLERRLGVEEPPVYVTHWFVLDHGVINAYSKVKLPVIAISEMSCLSSGDSTEEEELLLLAAVWEEEQNVGEVIPLNGAVAVSGLQTLREGRTSFAPPSCIFLLQYKNGRQITFRAPSVQERQEWQSSILRASSFRLAYRHSATKYVYFSPMSNMSKSDPNMVIKTDNSRSRSQFRERLKSLVNSEENVLWAELPEVINSGVLGDCKDLIASEVGMELGDCKDLIASEVGMELGDCKDLIASEVGMELGDCKDLIASEVGIELGDCKDLIAGEVGIELGDCKYLIAIEVGIELGDCKDLIAGEVGIELGDCKDLIAGEVGIELGDCKDLIAIEVGIELGDCKDLIAGEVGIELGDCKDLIASEVGMELGDCKDLIASEVGIELGDCKDLIAGEVGIELCDCKDFIASEVGMELGDCKDFIASEVGMELANMDENQVKIEELKFQVITSEMAFNMELPELINLAKRSVSWDDPLPSFNRRIISVSVEKVKRCSDSLLGELELYWQQKLTLEGLYQIFLEHRQQLQAYITYISHLEELRTVFSSAISTSSNTLDGTLRSHKKVAEKDPEHFKTWSRTRYLNKLPPTPQRLTEQQTTIIPTATSRLQVQTMSTQGEVQQTSKIREVKHSAGLFQRLKRSTSISSTQSSTSSASFLTSDDNTSLQVISGASNLSLKNVTSEKKIENIRTKMESDKNNITLEFSHMAHTKLRNSFFSFQHGDKIGDINDDKALVSKFQAADLLSNRLGELSLKSTRQDSSNTRDSFSFNSQLKATQDSTLKLENHLSNSLKVSSQKQTAHFNSNSTSEGDHRFSESSMETAYQFETKTVHEEHSSAQLNEEMRRRLFSNPADSPSSLTIVELDSNENKQEESLLKEPPLEINHAINSLVLSLHKDTTFKPLTSSGPIITEVDDDESKEEHQEKEDLKQIFQTSLPLTNVSNTLPEESSLLSSAFRKSANYITQTNKKKNMKHSSSIFYCDLPGTNSTNENIINNVQNVDKDDSEPNKTENFYSKTYMPLWLANSSKNLDESSKDIVPYDSRQRIKDISPVGFKDFVGKCDDEIYNDFNSVSNVHIAEHRQQYIFQSVNNNVLNSSNSGGGNSHVLHHLTSSPSLNISSNMSSIAHGDGYEEVNSSSASYQHMAHNTPNSSVSYTSATLVTQHKVSRCQIFRTSFEKAPLYQHYIFSSLSSQTSGRKMNTSGLMQAIEIVSSSLQRLRENDEFLLIWGESNKIIVTNNLQPLSLPRQKKPPMRYTSPATAFTSTSVEDYLHHEYFAIIDTAVGVKECSEHFVQALMGEWENDLKLGKMSDLLHQFATSEFKIYVDYCTNQVHIKRIILDLMEEDKTFAEALSKLEADPTCQNFSLISFLTLPIQRVTRFALLVDGVMKYVPDTDQSLQHWKKTITVLREPQALLTPPVLRHMPPLSCVTTQLKLHTRKNCEPSHSRR
uniref:(California timema) hypothetical protein n=1 Tax=Timema californicum TaxID=61474 RepID=A0A7R9IYR8_TIMCA|nr:unnamed protein product [Timema californicum]